MVQASRRARTGANSSRKLRNNRLLVVIDESSSAKQTLEYLARV